MPIPSQYSIAIYLLPDTDTRLLTDVTTALRLPGPRYLPRCRYSTLDTCSRYLVPLYPYVPRFPVGIPLTFDYLRSLVDDFARWALFYIAVITSLHRTTFAPPPPALLLPHLIYTPSYALRAVCAHTPRTVYCLHRRCPHSTRYVRVTFCLYVRYVGTVYPRCTHVTRSPRIMISLPRSFTLI